MSENDAVPAVTAEAGPRRRRDPAARRHEIVEAAAELVTEIGAASLTHRLVATRAGVALGTTTRYFASIDDLRSAALVRLSEDVQVYVEQVGEALSSTGSVDDALVVLAEGLHAYLLDPRMVRADAMLSASAAVDPHVRPLTDAWFGGLTNVLVPHVGPDAAQRIVIFIEGATWHAALNDAPPLLATITSSLQALTGIQATETTQTTQDEENSR